MYGCARSLFMKIRIWLKSIRLQFLQNVFPNHCVSRKLNLLFEVFFFSIESRNSLDWSKYNERLTVITSFDLFCTDAILPNESSFKWLSNLRERHEQHREDTSNRINIFTHVKSIRWLNSYLCLGRKSC